MEDSQKDLTTHRTPQDLEIADLKRENNAAFERIKELFDERAEVHAGRAALRIFLWVAGSVLAGAATILLAVLGLKKG